MLKNLTILIATGLLVTYAWGWVADVHFGSMSTKRYTSIYFAEVQDVWEHLLTGFKQIPAFVGDPLPRRQLEYEG
jgi:hypothetical protein